MTCAHCSTELGERYYSDVPKVGDLCLDCHKEWAKTEYAVYVALCSSMMTDFVKADTAEEALSLAKERSPLVAPEFWENAVVVIR